MKHSAPTGLRKRRSSSSPEINAKVDFRGKTDIDNDVSQVGASIADDVKVAASNGLQAKVRNH